MPLDRDAALRDIDSVLEEAQNDAPDVGSYGTIERATTMYLSCIERHAPSGSPQMRQALRTEADDSAKHNGFAADRMRGILLALRSDVQNDRLRTFEEQVHDALFADLLSAAEHFVDVDGLLLPAAVMAGGTLEEHLRQLATKNGIPTEVATKSGGTTPKKASVLNVELCAHAKALLQTERSDNQAWLDLRNLAAHNKDEFRQGTPPQVMAMINGIRGFITRHPA